VVSCSIIFPFWVISAICWLQAIMIRSFMAITPLSGWHWLSVCWVFSLFGRLMCFWLRFSSSLWFRSTPVMMKRIRKMASVPPR